MRKEAGGSRDGIGECPAPLLEPLLGVVGCKGMGGTFKAIPLSSLHSLHSEYVPLLESRLDHLHRATRLGLTRSRENSGL